MINFGGKGVRHVFSWVMISALACITGIMLSKWVSLSTLLLFAGSVLAASGLTAVFLHKKNNTIIISAVFLAIGGVRCYNAYENRLYYEFPDKYVTVTGTIASTPINSYGDYKYKYTLYADTVSYLGKTYSVGEKIRVGTKYMLDYGDRVQMSGFLNKFDERKNETDFDVADYYGSKGIKTRMTAYETARIKGENKFRIINPIGIFKNKIYNLIGMRWSGDDAAMMYALLLGDKSYFSNDYYAQLVSTGVIHSVYSPYMHILILTFLAGLIFRKNKQSRELVMMCLLVVYALYNSSSPTGLKAALLGAFVIFRRQLFGFSNRADCLAVIVLAMTMIDPLLCFNGAFVLSVASSLLVCVVYEPIYRKLQPWLDKIFFGKSAVSSAVVMMMVLSIGTLPLVAYYYNGVSPYSIILAPILLPFVAAVVIFAPPLLVISGGFGTVPVLGAIVDGALGVIKISPEIVSRLPFNHVMLAKPEVLEILTCYLAMWLAIRVITGKLNTEFSKIILTFISAFMLCLALDISVNSMDIYFVNVGQGDGAVLHTGTGDTILIDGGGAPVFQENYNVGEKVYLPYLIAHGFTHVDTAIVSHYHKDHVEGIIAAAENLKIDTLAMPDAAPDNEYRQKLEQIAAERGIEVEYLMEGDVLNYGSGVKINILAPDDEQLAESDENDTSIVAEVHYGDFVALFTGDSADEVNENYSRNIDLLKVAHHGSATANDADFVGYVNPKYAVISVGADNEYNLPSNKVLVRYLKVGSRILRTDRLGDIHFKISNRGGVKYRSFRDEN